MKTLVVYFLFLVLSIPLMAQDYCAKLQFCSHASSDITPEQIRGWLSVPSSTSVQVVKNAQNIVNRILCLANSSTVEIDVRGDDCPNAVAVTCTDKKYILFSTDYLINVMSSGDSSAIYGVFAHEIGHLIKGDAWMGGSKEQRHLSELNADKFAGHILGLLGFLKQTAVATLYAVNDQVSDTHPPKQQRELKIIEGWTNGQKNRQKILEKTVNYIINCKSDKDAPFKIEYSIHKKFLSNLYYVEIRISGVPDDLKTIQSFTYFLHPTSFKKNSVTLHQVKPYTIEIWGSFELRASIVCKDKNGLINEYVISEQIALYNNEIKGGVDIIYIEETPKQKNAINIKSSI